MLLTYAHSCLTYAPRFQSVHYTLTVTRRSLKARSLVFMSTRTMGPKRALSSLPEPKLPSTDKNKGKRVKGCVAAESENGVVVKDTVAKINTIDIQSLREDVGKVETMTFHELRSTLRSIGVPAKGCKNDLVTILKSFINNKDESSKLAEKSSSPKMKEINHENVSIKRETKNNKVIFDKNSGQLNAKLGTTTQKVSIKTEDDSGKQGSFSKRKVSSKISVQDVKTSNQVDLYLSEPEPWTVLTHMKPQPGWIPYNPKTMRPPSPLADTKTLKLMSWNVNGLRALMKLEGFSALELAEREDFDVLCLQETKLQEKDVEAIKQRLIQGYENSFWTCSVSKLGYSGTAIISRIKPLSVRYGLGIADHDTEGRLVTVEFDSFYLISGYIPNSGDGLKRLSYRVTEWDPSLSKHMKELEKSKPVILTGDLNCSHCEIDIHNPAGNRRTAGFTDEERESFEVNFLSKGFVDTFRAQHPDTVGYTYWGYRHNARKANKGWRLDYFLVSESIADKVHDSYILPDVVGSDHCPIGLILKL